MHHSPLPCSVCVFMCVSVCVCLCLCVHVCMCVCLRTGVCEFEFMCYLHKLGMINIAESTALKSSVELYVVLLMAYISTLQSTIESVFNLKINPFKLVRKDFQIHLLITFSCFFFHISCQLTWSNNKNKAARHRNTVK